MHKELKSQIFPFNMQLLTVILPHHLVEKAEAGVVADFMKSDKSPEVSLLLPPDIYNSILYNNIFYFRSTPWCPN